MPTDSDVVNVRQSIAETCRALAEQGLVMATAGNVSVALDPDRIAITATGARFESMTAEQVVVVDNSGRVVHGDLAPTSEVELHLGIHRARGAGAIVHTHAPKATAVGLVVDELPCIHYQMLGFGGSVRVAPYATFGSPELAAHVLAALDGRSAALMANHGAVTQADDLRTAVEHALLLEWACGIFAEASTMGTPRFLDQAAQLDVIAVATRRGYGATQPARQED